MQNSNERVEELVISAKNAIENAYAPYSHFKVGAAVLTETGKIYSGCNVENGSFGATNCAERTAIFKAVSEGERKIKAVAIASADGRITPPCGICRQVMSEFMEDNGLVILACNDGENKVYTLSQLLPERFLY